MLQTSHESRHIAQFLRKSLCTCLALLLFSSSVSLVTAADPQDSQLFVNAINDYKKGDFPAVVTKLTQVLTKYPQTPLRDMTLYWLGRAYYKVGNQQEAAKNLSLFKKEYPDNPLIYNIEEELAEVITKYERGAKLAAAGAPVKPVVSPEELDRIAKQKAAEEAAAAEKAAAEKLATARAAAEKAAQEKIAAERAAAERLAAAKVAEDRLRVENAEIARLSEVTASEQLAAAKAAVVKAEAERQAAEANRAATEKSAEARVAAALAAVDKAEAERRVAEKAAQEYQAAATVALKIAEGAKKAAEEYQATAAKALQVAEEAKKSATIKPVVVPAVNVVVPVPAAAAEARLAAERLATERAAREKAEAELKSERAARLKAEKERALAEQRAVEQTENALKKERAARLKAEEERAAAERRAAELLDIEKAARAAKSASKPSAPVAAPVTVTMPPLPVKIEPANKVTTVPPAAPQSRAVVTEDATGTNTSSPPAESKPIEFSDLPPAKQSELEFLCFQAKAKGRFQFNECIKSHLDQKQ